MGGEVLEEEKPTEWIKKTLILEFAEGGNGFYKLFVTAKAEFDFKLDGEIVKIIEEKTNYFSYSEICNEGIGKIVKQMMDSVEEQIIKNTDVISDTFEDIKNFAKEKGWELQVKVVKG
jgi:hypothetical protein